MTASQLSPVFEPGFFTSGPVRVALIVGAMVAIVSGIVGVFTVIRGQSFAGHAFADIGTAGGSAAFLLGASTLYGFVTFNVLAAGVMELIGIRRPRGRDLATGIVLGASLGLAALFLYEDTIHTSTTGATINVLFGSIFTISRSTVPTIAALGVVALALMAVFYRPLLLSSVSYDLAAARGVPVRLVGAGYLLALALAVSLSAVTIGAILSTALLIGPAAISLRVATRTGTAIAVAAGLGVLACWAGTLIAYDSTEWTGGRGWPASFCIVAVIFFLYFAGAIVARGREWRGGGRGGGGRRVGPRGGGRAGRRGVTVAAGPGPRSAAPRPGPGRAAPAWPQPRRAREWPQPRRAREWPQVSRAREWPQPRRAPAWPQPRRAPAPARSDPPPPCPGPPASRQHEGAGCLLTSWSTPGKRPPSWPWWPVSSGSSLCCGGRRSPLIHSPMGRSPEPPGPS